jgi:hypothetical protein
MPDELLHPGLAGSDPLKVAALVAVLPGLAAARRQLQERREAEEERARVALLERRRREQRTALTRKFAERARRIKVDPVFAREVLRGAIADRRAERGAAVRRGSRRQSVRRLRRAARAPGRSDEPSPSDVTLCGLSAGGPVVTGPDPVASALVRRVEGGAFRGFTFAEVVASHCDPQAWLGWAASNFRGPGRYAAALILGHTDFESHEFWERREEAA